MAFKGLDGYDYYDYSEKERADAKWKLKKEKEMQQELQKEKFKHDKKVLEEKKKLQEEAYYQKKNLQAQEYENKRRLQQEEERAQRQLEAERQAHDNEMRLSGFYSEAGINRKTFESFDKYLFSADGINAEDNEKIRQAENEFNTLNAQLNENKQIEQNRAAHTGNVKNCENKKRRYTFFGYLRASLREFEWYGVVSVILLVALWGFISYDMIPYTDFIYEETAVNLLYLFTVAFVAVLIVLVNLFMENIILRYISGFAVFIYGLYSLLVGRLDLMMTGMYDTIRLAYNHLTHNNVLSPVTEIFYTPFVALLGLMGVTFPNEYDAIGLIPKMFVYLPAVAVIVGLAVWYAVNKRYRQRNISELDNSIGKSNEILAGCGNEAEKLAEIAGLEREIEERRRIYGELKAKAIGEKWKQFHDFRLSHYNYKIESLLMNLGIPEKLKQYNIAASSIKKDDSTGSGDIEDYVSFFESKEP